MLRRPVPHPNAPDGGGAPAVVDGEGAATSSQAPLRWRLALLTAVVVAAAVGAMTILTYWTISTTLTGSVDRNLDGTAESLISNAADPDFQLQIDEAIEDFKEYNPDTRVSILLPQNTYASGDRIPAGETSGTIGGANTSTRTVGPERVLTKRDAGVTVVLARDMASTHQLIGTLGAVLLVITALGIALAIAAGMVVATAGLRPLSRLQRAVDHVTRTNDLRPIQVVGNDELAQLTGSFNAMLLALQDSRTRQTQLVADAGHELKTPLTSIRTNIDLLIMLNHSTQPHNLSDQDILDLEDDVRAQLDEMSRLIGDLVDLAREESTADLVSEINVDDVLRQALERVQRRRPDVSFDVESIDWTVSADSGSLSRGVVNLLDNAVKWSPDQGTVRVRLAQADDHTAEITVADSGPGIPEGERERVFERFYRSTESRSMPGSGLGLAIVKQVIERLGGEIRVEDSDDGGTLMRVSLPGNPPDTEAEAEPKQLPGQTPTPRNVAPSDRWSTRW